MNNWLQHGDEALAVVHHSGGGSSGGGGGGGPSEDRKQQDQMTTQLLKSEIAVHPLCEQLLSAHVGCLRVATPIDHLPLIDAQLGHSHHLLRSYASHHRQLLSPQDKQELDQFLAQYLVVLCSFKEQLQHHVRVHAVEAVMACNEIEKSLHDLTGVTLEEGTGATMSDDEDDDQPLDSSLDAEMSTPHDMMGFGPLLPTESERTLMERVRHELKHELKQGFRSRIEDIREEILRKRRAGKLAGDATTILQQWWQQHSKWPYPTGLGRRSQRANLDRVAFWITLLEGWKVMPTFILVYYIPELQEEEKAKLVEETGLQLKQINNWFINRRKRNWHNNSQSATSLKSKRKR